jgi:hypothetical protein
MNGGGEFPENGSSGRNAATYQRYAAGRWCIQVESDTIHAIFENESLLQNPAHGFARESIGSCYTVFFCANHRPCRLQTSLCPAQPIDHPNLCLRIDLIERHLDLKCVSKSFESLRNPSPAFDRLISSVE